MRVTQFTFYNNFVTDQQRTLSELTKVQTQIATGKKIENMYDDPTVYTKFLKLDEEINSFTQISSSAKFAKTFAQESDTTLNDIVSTLSSFKSKLLTAANDTNNTTSREAIVSELKSELEHLKNLANTSLDGKYLFSGSAFDKKPIGDDYSYQGNDKSVKAFLGAGVEREYNIPGSELFLGRDNDYKKHMTLNVIQYDKMKANPQFVVRGADGNLYIDKHQQLNGTHPDSDNPPINETITIDSQIRMLTGVEDKYVGDGKYEDGISYFYIKGRKPNGESIDTKFSLSNSQSVKDLLDKIGAAYGNTATNKVVDVTLNDMGEIQIKDVNSGKMMSDFYMVASDSDEADISDLVKNGDYIVEFQKSNFKGIRDLSQATANNSGFDNRVFNFGLKFINGNRDAIPQDLAKDVFGSEAIKEGSDTIKESVDFVRFTGTDTSGNAVDVNIKITDTTTMQDVLDTIKNSFGDVNVSLENGKIVVTDNSLSSPTDDSKLSITMQTYSDSDNDGVFHTHDDMVKALRRDDVANFDKLYMDKNGNEIKGNVSNIQKDYITYFKDGQKIVEKNPNAQTYVTNDTTLADSMGSDDIDGKVFEVTFKDQNGNFQKAIITLRNTPDAEGHLSTFWIDKNNDGVRDSDEVYDIYDANGNKTPANTFIKTTTEMDPTTCELCTKENVQKGLTYRQLGDVISMLVSGNIPADNTPQAYESALANAKNSVESGVDEKGRFYVKDKQNANTNIELAIDDKNSNDLYFQANDAITIDEPQTDFFEILNQAIEAVENGNNFADASSKDARNFGIQGAIEAIDHVMDRVRRSHAKIGAVSNEFDMTIQRVDMLKINVQTLQSENIDTDIGEATMRLNSLNTSYQGLLASIAKVNNLTLLNYLR